MDGARLEHVAEFKYLECVLDESCANDAECRRKAVKRRKVVGALRFLVNAKSLELE